MEPPGDRGLALRRRGVQQAGEQGSCPQQHHGRPGTGLDEIVQGDPQVVIPGREGQYHLDGPGFIGDFSVGSYANIDTTIGYHANVGNGSLVAAFRNQRGLRGFDPPNFDSPHNSYSNANQFLRYTLPTGPNFLNVTLSRSYRTYQIPNDVAGGQPANTDDNQTQEDLFAAMQFRHPIGDHGSLSFGPSYKRSRIRDLGDPANDFAFGVASNPGNPGDCAQALSTTGPVVGGVVTDPQPNPNVSYVNGSCGFSLFSDRTAVDVGGNLDYVNHSPKHDVAFGGLYDATHVSKTYAVTPIALNQEATCRPSLSIDKWLYPPPGATMTDVPPAPVARKIVSAG